MRTFQGTFHGGPDFSRSVAYGWSEMHADLTRDPRIGRADAAREEDWAGIETSSMEVTESLCGSEPRPHMSTTIYNCRAHAHRRRRSHRRRDCRTARPSSPPAAEMFSYLSARPRRARDPRARAWAACVPSFRTASTSRCRLLDPVYASFEERLGYRLRLRAPGLSFLRNQRKAHGLLTRQLRKSGTRSRPGTEEACGGRKSRGMFRLRGNDGEFLRGPMDLLTRTAR